MSLLALRIASRHAIRVEFSLRRIARKAGRFAIVVAGDLPLAGAKLEFSKCSPVERVRLQLLDSRDRLYLLDAPIWPFQLADRDRAIQANHRRRLSEQQALIKR